MRLNDDINRDGEKIGAEETENPCSARHRLRKRTTSMLRSVSFGFSSLLFACMSAASHGQPVTGSGQGDTARGAAIVKHRDALIGQCPPVLVLSDAEAAALPIHVTRWGTAGPRVLVVHGGVQGGLGGGPVTFTKQERLAQDGWRIELVDRPGFGQSPSRGADDMQRDAVWIADMLGDGANLIGHSWGGAEALLAAGGRPSAVHSIVLIEPALPAVVTLDPSLKDNASVQEGIAQRVAMLMKAQSPAEYGRAFAHSLGSAPEGGSTSNASAAAYDANSEQAARVGCALLQAVIAPADVMQKAIESIAYASIPVLIITGGWNSSFDAAGDVLARLVHGRHVIVRSPSHFVQLANSDDFNRVVDAFMREAELVHRNQ